MRTPNAEIIVCLVLGSLLLVVGELFYAQDGGGAVAFGLLAGGFLLAPPALGLAYWRAPGTQLARVAAWAVWAASFVLAGAFVYGAARGALPMEPLVGVALVLVAGLAVGAAAVARGGLQRGVLAAAVPVSVPAWLVLEEAFPSWGGIAGAALFAVAAAVQVASMRRSLDVPMADAVSRTGS